MTSLLAAPPGGLVGAQAPRVLSHPEFASSAGVEAVELAASAGLFLDRWQQLALEVALGERRDGRWAAFEVGVVCPRQNGKNSIVEARELAGLFLLGERLIMHSAHQFDTALEAFWRVLSLIENTGDLSRRVKKVTRSHGEEGIELRSGQRLRFKARTSAGGRGFSGDCVILDEAMVLPVAARGALMPTLSARPNPQLWYTGSAVDQAVHEHGRVLTSVRNRGLAGGDESLAYLEWSAEPDADRSDPEVWAAANPGLGIRLSVEHTAREFRSMDSRTFATERLGIGDWPSLDDAGWSVFPEATWAALLDGGSRVDGGHVFALEVAPDRSRSTITVAGRRTDGLWHVEVADQRPGTGWVVDRCVDLQDRWSAPLVVDPSSPAGSLLEGLRAAGVEPVEVTARQVAQAFGGLFDAVTDGTVRHIGQRELTSAFAAAKKRPLADAQAIDRRTGVDVSAAMGACLALHIATRGTGGPSVYETRGLLAW